MRCASCSTSMQGGPATHLFLVLIVCRNYEKKSEFAGPPRSGLFFWCQHDTLRINADPPPIVILLSELVTLGIDQVTWTQQICPRQVPWIRGVRGCTTSCKKYVYGHSICHQITVRVLVLRVLLLDCLQNQLSYAPCTSICIVRKRMGPSRKPYGTTGYPVKPSLITQGRKCDDEGSRENGSIDKTSMLMRRLPKVILFIVKRETQPYSKKHVLQRILRQTITPDRD